MNSKITVPFDLPLIFVHEFKEAALGNFCTVITKIGKVD